MTVLVGDCRELMAAMEPDSVDAIVTDPPYGLSFMGKDWDRHVPGPEFWTAALRVARPGAHLLAFGGTRLWHRLAAAIEDAGWEIRDTVMWLHGQGMPKSRGCLKPSWEPVIMAARPGATASLNIDEARVPPGRWPANLTLDECAASALDEQTGIMKDGVAVNRNKDPNANKPHAVYGGGWKNGKFPDRTYGGIGGGSRFFYVAKASKAERNMGGADNRHPTVKPVKLMRWLVRLVTPPGGLVLDPFCGSGTTGIAATLEGFRFVGCELDPTHAEVARTRIAGAGEWERAA